MTSTNHPRTTRTRRNQRYDPGTLPNIPRTLQRSSEPDPDSEEPFNGPSQRVQALKEPINRHKNLQHDPKAISPTQASSELHGTLHQALSSQQGSEEPNQKPPTQIQAPENTKQVSSSNQDPEGSRNKPFTRIELSRVIHKPRNHVADPKNRGVNPRLTSELTGRNINEVPHHFQAPKNPSMKLLLASAVSEIKVILQLRREEILSRNRIRTPEAPASISRTLQRTRRTLSLYGHLTAELIWLVSELLSHGVSSSTTYPKLRQRPTSGLPHPTVLRLQAFSAS